MEKATLVTTGEDPKRWYQKRNVLIDAAVIFVVLLIIGVVWWVGHRPKPEPATTVPQYSGLSLVNEVNKKYGANDYLGAVKLIEGQKNVKDTSVQSMLASAYSNAGNYAKALEVYDALDKKGQLSENDAASAANAATRAKQYQKAIDLYKKAKELLGKSSESNVDQAAVYDYQIAELEKKL
jgi:pentatricopeptide repeat protein